MKMVAQVLQQKGIGEYLGESVGVKAAVGVNTDLIKAIRPLLEQPGATHAGIRHQQRALGAQPFDELA